MTIIWIIILVMFLLLITWSWHSLGNIETKTKIPCLIGGLVGIYIITFIIYNISKVGIKYDEVETMKIIRNIFVIIFSIVNGYILLPYIFRKLNKINNQEIQKEEVKRSIIIVLIILVLLFIFESLYLGNVQQGILKVAK